MFSIALCFLLMCRWVWHFGVCACWCICILCGFYLNACLMEGHAPTGSALGF